MTWSRPTSDASWTHSKLYRATSQTGTYSLVVTQAIADTTYYDENGGTSSWYKVTYYDNATAVESGYSDAFQGTSGTTYYTTPARVASRLQIQNSQSVAQFDGTTKPTVWEVAEIIREVEARIEQETGHAWTERYAYDANDSNDYEPHHLNHEYRNLSGIPIYLAHRHVRTLTAGSGDSLQVFDGSSWVEWLGTYTEGRANDFWLDYRQGTLFLRTYIYRNRPWGVRIRYRYGEQTVPEDIKKAATLLTCAEIARMDDRAAVLPEAGAGISIASKAEQWEKEAAKIIHARKEFPVAVT